MPRLSRQNARDDGDVYMDLVRAFPLRVIKSDREADDAMAMLDSLLDKETLTAAEKEYFEVLEQLISNYEEENYKIERLPDCEIIRHLLSDNNISQVEFSRATKIAEPTISAILGGKRELTRNQIGVVAEFFRVSVDVFSHDPDRQKVHRREKVS